MFTIGDGISQFFKNDPGIELHIPANLLERMKTAQTKINFKIAEHTNSYGVLVDPFAYGAVNANCSPGIIHLDLLKKTNRNCRAGPFSRSASHRSFEASNPGEGVFTFQASPQARIA